MAARHSGRATRDPDSRGKNLDSRLRGNDRQGYALGFYSFAAGVTLWTAQHDSPGGHEVKCTKALPLVQNFWVILNATKWTRLEE